LNTISYGKERPAVTEASPSGWAQNRRAVTVVN
jgi:peptidoglycan-associated lipoprotein